MHPRNWGHARLEVLPACCVSSESRPAWVFRLQIWSRTLCDGKPSIQFRRERTFFWEDGKAQTRDSYGPHPGLRWVKIQCLLVLSYSGYIPKGEHYFGKPYADTCLSAIASFQGDQVKHHRKIQDLRTIADVQAGKEVPAELLSKNTKTTTKYKTPLQSITVRPKAYYSPYALQHSLSPFIMSNDDPKKFLMSGYTGFVPRARGEMGMGYPLLTNKALCEFTNESERLRRVKDLPVVVERPGIKIVDTKPIYMMDSGQVPHYTGHVPGK